MITYRLGNLLDTPDPVIVHGCNAQGVMGSGVAKAIREKYPKAYDEYKAKIEEFKTLNEDWSTVKPHFPQFPLGQVIVSHQDDGKAIWNAITQTHYGKDGLRYVSYDAIDMAMTQMMCCFSMTVSNPNISMPKIGAGLGGGDWDIIKAIIERHLGDYNVTVWVLDGKI